MRINDLGAAKRIIIGKDNTTLVEGKTPTRRRRRWLR